MLRPVCLLDGFGDRVRLGSVGQHACFDRIIGNLRGDHALLQTLPSRTRVIGLRRLERRVDERVLAGGVGRACCSIVFGDVVSVGESRNFVDVQLPAVVGFLLDALCGVIEDGGGFARVRLTPLRRFLPSACPIVSARANAVASMICR